MNKKKQPEFHPVRINKVPSNVQAELYIHARRSGYSRLGDYLLDLVVAHHAKLKKSNKLKLK